MTALILESHLASLNEEEQHSRLFRNERLVLGSFVGIAAWVDLFPTASILVVYM